MAILRLSTGEVVAGYAEINELIVPAGMEVGRFSCPESLEARVKDMEKPLTPEGAGFVFGELSSNVEGVVNDLGFSYSYRRAGVFVPPNEQGISSFSMAGDSNPEEVVSAEMKASDTDDYDAPHILRVNNLHFAYAGSFVKGMQLEGNLQAMIYVTAGEWQRLDPNILTWVIFSIGEPVLGLSYFDAMPDENGGFETDVIPDHKVHESMNF